MGISFHTNVMKCSFRQFLRVLSYTGRRAKENKSSILVLPLCGEQGARAESGALVAEEGDMRQSPVAEPRAAAERWGAVGGEGGSQAGSVPARRSGQRPHRGQCTGPVRCAANAAGGARALRSRRGGRCRVGPHRAGRRRRSAAGTGTHRDVPALTAQAALASPCSPRSPSASGCSTWSTAPHRTAPGAGRDRRRESRGCRHGEPPAGAAHRPDRPHHAGLAASAPPSLAARGWDLSHTEGSDFFMELEIVIQGLSQICSARLSVESCITTYAWHYKECF